jgi:hypothetical protein
MNNKNRQLLSYTDHIAPKKPAIRKTRIGKVNVAKTAQENIGKAMRG